MHIDLSKFRNEYGFVYNNNIYFIASITINNFSIITIAIKMFLLLVRLGCRNV